MVLTFSSLLDGYCKVLTSLGSRMLHKNITFLLLQLNKKILWNIHVQFFWLNFEEVSLIFNFFKVQAGWVFSKWWWSLVDFFEASFTFLPLTKYFFLLNIYNLFFRFLGNYCLSNIYKIISFKRWRFVTIRFNSIERKNVRCEKVISVLGNILCFNNT